MLGVCSAVGVVGVGEVAWMKAGAVVAWMRVVEFSIVRGRGVVVGAGEGVRGWVGKWWACDARLGKAWVRAHVRGGVALDRVLVVALVKRDVGWRRFACKPNIALQGGQEGCGGANDGNG